MVDPSGIDQESQVGLSPGTRLGKYQIVRLLGSGGMGAVYEAAHTEMGKRVAVKVLSPAIAAVPGARARFLREAQLTSRVRHPNIVDVTDLGTEGGQAYLVMEFLRGEDLAQRLERSGPLPPQHLADIMLPVCSAVVEAHKSGITHRDLKPQNIFLAVGPHTTQPKVLDFGISKGDDLGGAALTGTGAMIGTPFYLAPEQIIDARAAGPSSDQYALGVIMYECLTGQRPFEAENLYLVFQAIVSGNPIPPSKRRPGVPATLEAVVLRAMSLAPEERFPSTLSLGRALLPFASNKMRSIWEEAFADGADFGVIEAAASKDSGIAPPPLLPAVGPGATALQTPGALGTPPPVFPATPGGRVRLAAPASTPANSWKTIGPAAAPTVDHSVVPAGAGRSRAWMGVAVVGLVVVGGLIAGVALQRSGATAPASGAATHQVPAGPLAASGPSAGEGPMGNGKTMSGRAAPEKLERDPAREDEPRAEREAAAPKSFRVDIKVEPARAVIELDGEMAGRRHLQRDLPLDGTLHKLRIAADGYEEQTLEFTDQSPPRSVKLNRIERARSEPVNTRGNSRATRRTRPEGVTAPPWVPQAPYAPPSVAPSPPPPRTSNPNGAPVID